jgi:hypothetical protein
VLGNLFEDEHEKLAERIDGAYAELVERPSLDALSVSIDSPAA